MDRREKIVGLQLLRLRGRIRLPVPLLSPPTVQTHLDLEAEKEVERERVGILHLLSFPRSIPPLPILAPQNLATHSLPLLILRLPLPLSLR